MPAPKGQRLTREEINALLLRYRESGQSQRAFSEANGISKNTLAFWIHRQRKEATSTRALVPVSTDRVPCDGSFELEVSGILIRVPRNATAQEWQALREAWIG